MDAHNVVNSSGNRRTQRYASLLAQAGADLLTISKLLGHADTRVTSRHYAHLCDRTLANAVNTLLPNFGHQPEENVVQMEPARPKRENVVPIKQKKSGKAAS